MSVSAMQKTLSYITFCLDLDPQVNFYWMRGQRTIPRGHRGGRVEPIRFQIDDKPHSQIRIPQQLPQVLHTVTSRLERANMMLH